MSATQHSAAPALVTAVEPPAAQSTAAAADPAAYPTWVAVTSQPAVAVVGAQVASDEAEQRLRPVQVADRDSRRHREQERQRTTQPDGGAARDAVIRSR
ncbi:hypothetical protein [Plantactinospora sp. B5E13]|uniref:hypothetical protein n=1 Tax=unclassified Plantactinospora TaxID=2631981 RepID=UPI00325D8CBC